MIVAGLGGGDGIRIVLETEEAMLLSELADQVDSVLLLGEADDPALGRLLPNAYPEDLEASDEFTRYTRESLVGVGTRQQSPERRVVGFAEQQHRVDLVGELGQQHRLLGLEHEPNAVAAAPAARDDHPSLLATVACRP